MTMPSLCCDPAKDAALDLSFDASLWPSSKQQAAISLSSRRELPQMPATLPIDPYCASPILRS